MFCVPEHLSFFLSFPMPEFHSPTYHHFHGWLFLLFEDPHYAELLLQFSPSFIVPSPHKSLIVAIYCSMLGCVLWSLIFMSLHTGEGPQPQQNIGYIDMLVICACMCAYVMELSYTTTTTSPSAYILPGDAYNRNT